MKRILGASVILAILFSCSAPEREGGDGGFTLFTGTPGSGEARIALGERTASGEGFVYPGLWEENDALSLYRISDGQYLGDALLTSGAGTALGSFRFDGSTGDAPVRLVWPAGAALYGENDLPGVQQQSGADARPLSACGFAVSGVTGPQQGNNFALKHIPALVRIGVSAGLGTAYQGAQLHALTFRVPGAALSGHFRYDPETERITPGEDAQDAVTVNLTEPLVLDDERRDVWLSALPCDCTGRLVLVSLELERAGVHTAVTVKFTGKELCSGCVHSLRVTDLTSLVTPADYSLPEYTYTSINYKKKVENSSWSTASQVRTVDGMNHLDRFAYNTLDRFGGYKGVKPDYITSTNTEGFWRTGWYRNRPVFVNPDGNVTFLHGVNGVGPVINSDFNNATWQSIYNARFGLDNAAWAAWAGSVLADDYEFNFYSSNASRIKYYRGNAAGYGNTPDTDDFLMHPASQETSQFQILYMLRTFIYDYYSLSGGISPLDDSVRSRFVFLFDPRYLDYIDALAAYAASIFRDEKNFIGYITDNELGFRFAPGNNNPSIRLADFLTLDTGDGYPDAFAAAKAYAEQFMRDRGVTPAVANVTEALDEAFLDDVATYYYRTVTEALRRHDPNHLLLGNRLHGKPMSLPTVVKACARFNDVVTVNVYGYWEPSSDYFTTNIKSWIGEKPVMITEFYTCSASENYKGTAYNNGGEGGGWIVPDQAARGKFYQNWAIRCLELGNIVGWEWFQFYDEFNDKGWKNKGLTSPYFSAYSCSPYFRQLHRNIYQIMDYFTEGPSGGGAGSLPEGIWE